MSISPVSNLLGVENFIHRKLEGRTNLSTNATDRIYDELDGYLRLCEERSAANPDAELGYLESIAKYKITENEMRARVQKDIKEILLSEAGLDQESQQTFPEQIRERMFNEFSQQYLGFNHQYGNLADPLIKAANEAMTWEQMVDGHIGKLAGSITNKMMRDISRSVYASHGQAAVG